LALTGGIVFVPPGRYVFEGNLTIPSAVSLKGSFEFVPSHKDGKGESLGSWLLPKGGRNAPNSFPFLSVLSDASVEGFTIFYPEVNSSSAPVPYPWTIELSGNNCAVADVELLNSWNGISAVGSARHYIARVQGQPTNLGIFVDQTYDIGRIEDVHFNPWFNNGPPYVNHQYEQVQKFKFSRHISF
jgi:hypothetical protein